MSLQVGLLQSESPLEAIRNTLISLVLAALAILLFVGIMQLAGLNVVLDGLVETSITDFFFGENRGQNIANTLYWSAPLILTALSVGIAFQAGLFNIGGQGQMVLGGVFTGAWGAAIMPSLVPSGSIFLKAWFMIPSSLLIGFLAGAIWGYIPGVLKAKTGAHEVITTIMMNQIAAAFATYLVGSTDYSPFISKKEQAYSQTDQVVQGARFGLIVPNQSGFFNWGILVPLFVVIFAQLLIYRSKYGFKLRAVGLNRHASEAAGINTDRITISSMFISGGVAGLAGSIFTMGTFPYKYFEGNEGTLGFDGIAVSLIAQNSPIGIAIAAIFFGYLIVTKSLLDRLTDIPPNLVIAFQGWIFIFAAAPALSKYIVSMRKHFRKSRGQNSEVTSEKQEPGRVDEIEPKAKEET